MRKDYRQNFRIGSNVKKIEQAFGAKKKKKKKMKAFKSPMQKQVRKS